jgi:competence ComEA-like helix-hairpin-helix protein
MEKDFCMLNLSKQERQVILFLAIVSLAGIGIDYLRKNFSSSKVIACINRDVTKIDLNQADKSILISLKGIGEKLAGRILEYRRLQGKFSNVEELKNIKGITEYRYEKIKDNFVIR